MREAILGAPARVTAPRSSKKTVSAGDPPPRQRGQPGRRPGRPLSVRLALMVGSAGFSAMMIGIVLNATMMQKGHHPAPLFASAMAPRPASSALPSLPEPVPAPAPAPAAVVPLPVPMPAPPMTDDRTESLPSAAMVRPQAKILGKGPIRTPALASKSGVPVVKSGAPARHVDGIAHLLGPAPARKPQSLAKAPATLPFAKATHAARNDKAEAAPAVN